MPVFLLTLPGSEIPDSPGFRAAFVIATVLYVISMAVLFALYRKAVKKIPPKPDDKKDVRSRRNKRRQP